MLKRIAKSVLTRKFNTHLRTGTKVVKLEYRDMILFITPGSNRVMCVFSPKGHTARELLSVPRISDYIVERGDYEGFWNLLKTRI